MKIKQYRAPDMRQALRQVRDAQGPDAVILSSRRVSGGVEVVAAVDYAEEQVPDAGCAAESSYGLIERQENVAPRRASKETPAPASAAALAERAIRDGSGLKAGQAAALRSEPHAHSYAAAAAQEDDFAEGNQEFAAALQSAQRRGAAPMDEVTASITDSALSEELRTMRRMLETQFASLAWNDLSRRAPIQTELLKQLTALGLAPDLAAELVGQLPPKLELAEAHRMALALLARRMEVANEPWVDAGGIVAMVGPTGVGKTTLIAKLAARWVMRHGPRDIALVSADAVRIGAQEQIHTLGRLLGVPAYAVDSVEELPELLATLAGKRLVLIDTAGLSQRDERLAGELEALAAAHPQLQTTLVLSAASQAGAIEETVERFAAAKPANCVLTKLDEATSLGGAISMLVRTKLPAAYCSDGQRIPEDLSPARAHQLVARAVDLARKTGAHADEDLLQRRFGAVAHALA